MFSFYFVKYVPISMGDYKYPAWGEALGFIISLSSMLWVPGYALYFVMTSKGSWREVLRLGVTPVIKARPEAVLAEIKYNSMKAADLKDVELNLLEKTNPESLESPSEEAEERAEEREEERKEEQVSLAEESEAPPAYGSAIGSN